MSAREMTPARWQLLKSITVAPRDITFPSVVLYFRPSCGSCTLMLPAFLDVMKREGNVVKFFAVDTAVHGNATGDKGLLLPEAQSRTVPHVVFQHSPKKQIVYTDLRQVTDMVNFIQKEMKRSSRESGDGEAGNNEGESGDKDDDGDADETGDKDGDEGESGEDGDDKDDDGDRSPLDGGSTDRATRDESSFDDDASPQQTAQDASNKKIHFNKQLTYKQPRVREFLINSLYELKNKATARFGDEYSDMFDAENASVYFVGIKPYTYADYENNLAQITEEEEPLAKDEEEEEESPTSPSESAYAGITAGSSGNNEDGDEEEDGSTDDEEEEEDSDDEEEEEDSDDEEEEDSSSTDDEEEEGKESGEEDDDAPGVVSGGFAGDDGEEEESDDNQNSADDGDDTEQSLISQIRSKKCNTFLYDDVKSEIESSLEKHYFIFILLMPENIHFRVDGMPVFACITGDRNSGLSAKIYLKTNPVNILKLMCKQGFSRAPPDNILIQILNEMKYTVKQ